MRPQKIEAILFDVDDTLFDRACAQKTALELIVKRFPLVFGGCEMSRMLEAWRESDRFATADFEASAPSEVFRDTRTRKFLQLLHVQEDLVGAITEAYLTDYPSINAPIAGAVQLVKSLSLSYKVGVVSNSLPDVQYRKLETLGLRGLFSCIVLSEEFGLRKPDPRIFDYAAALLGTPPQQCLFVGDSFDSDVIGSKAAGMISCWFRRGKSPPVDANISPDFEIDELARIQEILLIFSTN
jgi:HAD superfamily hydrolase (TIGR01549 family)